MQKENNFFSGHAKAKRRMVPSLNNVVVVFYTSFIIDFATSVLNFIVFSVFISSSN